MKHSCINKLVLFRESHLKFSVKKNDPLAEMMMRVVVLGLFALLAATEGKEYAMFALIFSIVSRLVLNRHFIAR